MSKAFRCLAGALLFAVTCAAAAQTGQDTAALKAYFQSPEGKAKIAAVKVKAVKGDAAAQDSLGWFYRTGVGVPQDYSKAVYWYRKAADQNLADAQTALGVLYYKGHGVPKDYQQAAHWYRKAAEQGEVGAQYNLSILYVGGVGVPQDYSEAYFWASIAAATTNSPDGKLSVQNLTSIRDAVATDLTKTEILKVQERARKWFEDHAATP